MTPSCSWKKIFSCVPVTYFMNFCIHYYCVIKVSILFSLQGTLLPSLKCKGEVYDISTVDEQLMSSWCVN